eukprot:TRINITY_DN1291_c0_g1_i1.p1 TRINITY_DN1291_c0_g1~~TRINITY_DN1291_c0_g1_i1.p1  ORF type:complete len:381 (+),score=56.53 TRINITY_DN1291_c0_g1_i1:46-1143(+)
MFREWRERYIEMFQAWHAAYSTGSHPCRHQNLPPSKGGPQMTESFKMLHNCKRDKAWPVLYACVDEIESGCRCPVFLLEAYILTKNIGRTPSLRRGLSPPTDELLHEAVAADPFWGLALDCLLIRFRLLDKTEVLPVGKMQLTLQQVAQRSSSLGRQHPCGLMYQWEEREVEKRALASEFIRRDNVRHRHTDEDNPQMIVMGEADLLWTRLALALEAHLSVVDQTSFYKLPRWRVDAWGFLWFWNDHVQARQRASHVIHYLKEMLPPGGVLRVGMQDEDRMSLTDRLNSLGSLSCKLYLKYEVVEQNWCFYAGNQYDKKDILQGEGSRPAFDQLNDMRTMYNDPVILKESSLAHAVQSCWLQMAS